MLLPTSFEVKKWLEARGYDSDEDFGIYPQQLEDLSKQDLFDLFHFIGIYDLNNVVDLEHDRLNYYASLRDRDRLKHYSILRERLES